MRPAQVVPVGVARGGTGEPDSDESYSGTLEGEEQANVVSRILRAGGTGLKVHGGNRCVAGQLTVLLDRAGRRPKSISKIAREFTNQEKSLERIEIPLQEGAVALRRSTARRPPTTSPGQISRPPGATWSSPPRLTVWSRR